MKTNVIALSLLISSATMLFTPTPALPSSYTPIKRCLKLGSHAVELAAGATLALGGLAMLREEGLWSFGTKKWLWGKESDCTVRTGYGVGALFSAVLMYNGYRGLRHELEGHHHYPHETEEAVVIVQQ